MSPPQVVSSPCRSPRPHQPGLFIWIDAMPKLSDMCTKQPMRNVQQPKPAPKPQPKAKPKDRK
jgi:hypothetical protein